MSMSRADRSRGTLTHSALYTLYTGNLIELAVGVLFIPLAAETLGPLSRDAIVTIASVYRIRDWAFLHLNHSDTEKCIVTVTKFRSLYAATFPLKYAVSVLEQM